MIKRFLLVGMILIGLLDAGWLWADTINAQAQAGFEYHWWRDSETNTGYQLLVPIKISSEYKDFTFSILGGYAYTGHDSVVDGLNTLSQVMDTKVNLSYALINKLPFDVLFGLDFNIPTARINLSYSKLSLLMDPDLVPLSQYGEGFNLNPTVSIAKDWGRLITGLGIGYIWRGKYDFTSYHRNYDPGDIFTATAEARYDFTSFWSGRLFAQYARFGKDQWKERSIYREGDFYMAGIGICYAPKSWETSLTFRYVYRGKSELPVWPYDLTPMNHSLRGNEYAGDFVLSHHLNEPTTIWMKISGLYIQENDYPATDYYFVGKRQKAALELGVKRSFGAHWETSLFVRGFTMHDDKRFFPEYMDERTYNGFSVGAAITARF